MFIECTWMRHGHGPLGVTGIVTDSNQMQIWSLSSAAVTTLSSNLKSMTVDSDCDTNKHKEELQCRIKTDKEDRYVIEETL